MHQQPVGNGFDPGHRCVLPELGAVLCGEGEQGVHGEVCVEVAGLGVEAGRAVQSDAGPPLGDLARLEQGGIDAVGTQGVVDALWSVGTGVESAGPRQQGRPGLLLEAHPLVGSAAGEGDVRRVCIGPAEDPGRPVRAAPLVTDEVLLEEQDGMPSTGQLAGRRGADEPGTHDRDVVAVSRHRRLPRSR